MKKLRILLLAVIFGSVFFFLGRTILVSTAGKVKVIPFDFPTNIPLTEWQLKNSRPLTPLVVESPSYLSGRQYQYIQNDLTLDIEMRYLVNTKGDVKSFVQDYSSIPLSPGQSLLRQRSGIGFYNLFTYQQRAYLSSCINSGGGSTVTASQFIRNRYMYDTIYDMGFKERLIPWLQGRRGIRDMRCLWAQLSIPLSNSSPEGDYQTLEKVWFAWYQWWLPHFPQP